MAKRKKYNPSRKKDRKKKLGGNPGKRERESGYRVSAALKTEDFEKAKNNSGRAGLSAVEHRPNIAGSGPKPDSKMRNAEVAADIKREPEPLDSDFSNELEFLQAGRPRNTRKSRTKPARQAAGANVGNAYRRNTGTGNTRPSVRKKKKRKTKIRYKNGVPPIAAILLCSLSCLAGFLMFAYAETENESKYVDIENIESYKEINGGITLTGKDGKTYEIHVENAAGEY